MPTFSPVISNSVGVTITNLAGDLTYQDIVNLLGSVVLKVNDLYFNASTIQQLANTIQAVRFDMSGKQLNAVLITPVDPSQYQSSYFLNLREKGIILDQQTTFEFTINPNETVVMMFFSSRTDLDKYLQGKSNYQRAGFYGDFNDEI